jgi:Protein of unknown function (DUF3071)
MQDIRLVGNDGEYLNLETQSGDKFRLVLDDSLRSAVKRDTNVRLDAINISPREIQDAVRAGASASEVSEKHSVPLEYVEKFALTVVDEIGHIIASARSVRISVAADRYSEATQVEFGEVVAERIANAGGKNVAWSALKFDGMPWQLTVKFDSEDGETVAVWAFDQRKLVLSPDNALAIQLSGGDHDTSASTPKLRQIDPIDNSTQVIELRLSEPEKAEAPNLSVVSSIEELTKASLEVAEASAAEPSDVESRSFVSETKEARAEEAPLSATADLLEALRRKRAEASKAPADLSVSTPIVEQSEPVELSTSSDPVTTTPAVPAAKKGRPSMPSWDEIVFGTKADD